MDFILNFQFNSLIGICLYWVPLVFCVVFYTVRTAEGYMQDKEKREKAALQSHNDTYYYHPSETIGSIIGRTVVSVIPVANLWAALFDLSPKVFGRFFRIIGKVFDQPLVPKK